MTSSMLLFILHCSSFFPKFPKSLFLYRLEQLTRSKKLIFQNPVSVLPL